MQSTPTEELKEKSTEVLSRYQCLNPIDNAHSANNLVVAVDDAANGQVIFQFSPYVKSFHV